MLGIWSKQWWHLQRVCESLDTLVRAIYFLWGALFWTKARRLGGFPYSFVLFPLTDLRASVNALIKKPDSNNSRVTAIHLLDDKISDWWSKLPSCLQLTPSSVTEVPHNVLPNILHLHVIYHQCLCALHSSIVPLFCWSIGDDSRSSARQLSAQVAFENACSASALIDAVLSNFPKPEAIPSFVAYAAYCGCAIQIPFMWCSNPAVQERAHTNVRANIKMIHTLASYWKFCSILVRTFKYYAEISSISINKS